MKVTKWNGKPISEPGWYSGIPIERYHSAGMCDGFSISSSNLRTCWSESPAHMYDQWSENENSEPRKMTSAMLTGAVAHHLLLGEDDFRQKYVTYPEKYPGPKGEPKDWNNNATYCREWVADQIASKRIPVKYDVLMDIVSMAKSLATEPLVQEGLLSGYVETSGFWKDKETGYWLKIRPDVIPTGPDFVDLKTASEVTSPALMSSIRSHGYHQQGALIWEVCEALGQPFDSFVLAFIETKRPFCSRTVIVPTEDLVRGQKQNRTMLKLIKTCQDIGHWPGPGEIEGDLRDMGLSKDERERIDLRLKMEGVS